MKESRDLFQAIEGIDENGEVKAICCLVLEKKGGDQRMTPEIHKLVYMRNASVRIRLTSDFAVVELDFEGYADYDYLQAIELCSEFTAMTDACASEEKADSDPSLMLAMTPKAESDFFMMGMDALWSFVPEKPKGIYSAIRLIFNREKFGAYEFGNKE